jgi:diaminopimelate decarboxylase
VFSGVGKTREEMQFALEQDIFQFNIESEPELRLLSEIAASMNKEARIAIRVNPDVDPKTHAKISTGQKESKFGIPISRASEMYQLAASLDGITIQGISVHIGSQLTSLEPFREAFMRLREAVGTLRAEGINIEVIDLGGGLGIPYRQDEDAPPLPVAYGEMVQEVMQGLDGTFVFEPGRVLMGNAGILVSEVIYIKEAETRNFLIADAAMNDLLRPSLYSAFHEIIPVEKTEHGVETYDVVGPVCETGDLFAEQREVGKVEAGELIVFRTAGAYGSVMTSTYNARPTLAEVLVDGDKFSIIRHRETYEDLVARDQLPDWL